MAGDGGHRAALRILFLLFGLAALTGCAAPQPPRAVDGVLDLRGWDFARDGPVRLVGEWAFYWRQFPTSQELAGPSPSPPSGLVWVPGPWNHVQVEGEPAGSFGYATYRLRVLVDPATLPDAAAAIRMPPPTNTAHVLYVNGQRVGGAGQVGLTAETTRAAYMPYMAVFPRPEGELEILLYVSNFEHANGGVTEAPRFGPYPQVLDQFQMEGGRNLFLVGAIFIMGVYHLILFSLRRRERAYLYFGLFCLAVALLVISLLYPGIFARTISPVWSLLPRTGLFLGAGIALLLLAFTQALFPQESTPRWRAVVAGPGLLSLSVAYLLPIQRLSALFPVFALYLVAVTLFTLGIVLRAVRRGREGARTVLLGYLPLLTAMVNDVFFFSGQSQSGSLVAVGLVLYVLAHAYLLSRRFAQAFIRSESLADELGRNNAILTQAQGELRRREAQYRSIFMDANDLIFTTGLDGAIESINPACQALLGHPPQALIGRNAASLFLDEQGGQDLWGSLRMVTHSSLSVELRHRSGRAVPCTMTVSTRRDEETGRVLGYQAVVHDMTDMRRAETARERARQMQQEKAAVEAASQAKSRFLATMTHELRTPLNSILGYAQLLQNQNRLTRAQARGVSTILSSGRHLLDLIEDVLDLARIETDRLQIVYSEVDLAPLLADVLDAMRMEAEQKGLRLIGAFSPHLPAGIVTDEKRLRQILLNLLGNAIRYTEEGQVTLEVQPVSGPESDAPARLRFAVTDTGAGLTPDEIDRIFAPFEQAASGKDSQGLGLGLSISQRLAERLGSPIQVESAPGAGSRFWFEIPWDGSEREWNADDADWADERGSEIDIAALGLSRADLGPLYELTRLGDMKGVEAEAERLAAEYPAAQPFVEQVLVLAQGFNDQAIRKLVEQLFEQIERG